MSRKQHKHVKQNWQIHSTLAAALAQMHEHVWARKGTCTGFSAEINILRIYESLWQWHVCSAQGEAHQQEWIHHVPNTSKQDQLDPDWMSKGVPISALTSERPQVPQRIKHQGQHFSVLAYQGLVPTRRKAWQATPSLGSYIHDFTHTPN